MRRAGNMQTPVPRRSHRQRLCIQTVVPCTAHDFDPTFHVTRQIVLPCPPCPLVLLAQVFRWDAVPAETAVCGEFDTLRPTAAARIRPALTVDLAVMDDDLAGPGVHDRRANRHFLNLDTVGGLLIVLANLLREVQILFTLHWSQRWLLNGFDTIEPFDASSLMTRQLGQ